jgi:prepilin-type N-terminal cleavage/methylation domain-containing protein
MNLEKKIKSWRNRIPAASRGCCAFTLMEVMIAIGVFCIGVFAILDVVASVLHGARLLDKPMVDSGVEASVFAKTNSIVDGISGAGDLSEYLGDPYKGYDYAYTANEVESNRLYQVDIAVTSDAPGKPVVSKMSILLFRPQSPAGHLDSGYMNSH